MLDVLIVEDDGHKAELVKSVIAGIEGIDSSRIVVAPDERTTRENLSTKAFHLLVLDIQIPKLFGDPPRETGGLELLKGLRSRPDSKLPLHIIGLTAYDSSLKDAHAEFQQRLWALVKFSEEGTAWREQLREKVEYLIRATRALSLEPPYVFDIAVLCALPEDEFPAILRLPYAWKELTLPDDTSQYRTGNVKQNDRALSVVACTCPQMGMPAAAAMAAKVIHRFRPRVVILAGLAAGVRGKTNIGDVMVADTCWDYGSGKIEIHRKKRVFLPDPNPTMLEGVLKEKFRAISQRQDLFDEIKRTWPGPKPTSTLRLRIGPVPSGSAVVADHKVLQDLMKKSRKIIGLDMEGYGVCVAAHHSSHPRPVPVVIKSVSDFADGRKTQSDHFRQYAAYTSASTIDLCIRQGFF